MIAAFGMTRRRGMSAEEDPALRELADCIAPVCTLVGKTWALHLEKLVKVDRDENLRMIASSIEFLRGAGKRVVYDAEHFFDGYRAEPDYALRCVQAAAEAGAETVRSATPTAPRCPPGRGGDGGGHGRTRRRRTDRHPLP